MRYTCFVRQIALLLNIFIFSSELTFAETNIDLFLKGTQQYQDVIVEEVLSADTIRLESGEKIKLIGLKAPPVPEKMKQIKRDQYGIPIKEKINPAATIEEKSYFFVKELLEKKHIRCEFDVNRKNEQFETLAYVFLLKNNLFVNDEILRQGFAHLQIMPPNTKYADTLRSAYKEAREEKRGLQNE